MASFLQEAHGRLTAQRQIYIAEQLGLGKALFQEFRKDPKQEKSPPPGPFQCHTWIAYIHQYLAELHREKKTIFQAHIRVFGLRWGPKSFSDYRDSM